MHRSRCTVYLPATILTLVATFVKYSVWPSYIPCQLTPPILYVLCRFLYPLAHQSGREKSARVGRRNHCHSIASHVPRVTTHSFCPPSGTPSFRAFPMFQSVTQRVCSTPALLDLIFDHLDLSSNANNVVVSKVWSEVARDKLWWEVSDPRPLLSILAPISVAGVSVIAVVRTDPK